MMIFWCYFIAAVVVALDQLTKWLTVEYLMPEGSIPLIDGVLHLTYVENTGAAFGMMKDSRWVFMIVSTVAIVVLAVIIARYARQYRAPSVVLAMILGGGIGNMIDRVRLGYVVDFVDVRLINFAVFNVADSFVSVGAVLLILYLLRELIREGRTAKVGAVGAAGAEGGETADSAGEVNRDADSVTEKTDDEPEYRGGMADDSDENEGQN